MPPQTDLPPERLYESRVLFARAPSIVFPVVASVFVGMRFYVRRYIVGGVGPDDWLALLAVVCIWTTAGMMLWGTTVGYGRHTWDVGDSSLPQLRDLLTVYPLIAQMGSMTMQLSILTFYRRLSPSRGFHNLLYALMSFAVFSCVFRLVYTSIWCFHITPGPQFCTKVRSVGIIATIVSICLNSIIWCMPMPLLWRLKISIRKRLGLIILFSIGMIAVSASVAKLSVMKRRKRNVTDPPWVSPLLSLLYQVEVSIGIICACLPTLPPLLTQSSCFGRTQKALPVVVVDMEGLEGEVNSGSGTKLAGRANAGWEGASLTSTWQEVQKYYHTRWGRKGSIIEVADLEGFGVLDSYPENVHLNVNRQGGHGSLDLGEQIGLASMSSQPAEIKGDVRPDSSGKTHNPIHLQLSPPAPGVYVQKSGEIPQPVPDLSPTLQQSGGNDLKSGESVEGLLSSTTSISKLTTITTGKTCNTSGSSTT